LRDFVYEANRGPHVWFLASREELDRRLAREAIETAGAGAEPRPPSAGETGPKTE
jgi:hypothetical protein